MRSSSRLYNFRARLSNRNSIGLFEVEMSIKLSHCQKQDLSNVNQLSYTVGYIGFNNLLNCSDTNKVII